MVKAATASELQEILSESSEELKQQLGIERAQFMLPVDGKGLRILVIRPSTETSQLPDRVAFALSEKRQVEIRLEASDEFQDYKLHRDAVAKSNITKQTDHSIRNRLRRSTRPGC